MTPLIQKSAVPTWETAFFSGSVNIGEGRYYLFENIPPSISDQGTGAEGSFGLNPLHWLLKNVFEGIEQNVFLDYLHKIMTRGDGKEIFQSGSAPDVDVSQGDGMIRLFEGEHKDMAVWANALKKWAADVGGKVYPPPLQDALKDLDEAREEAHEEEYPQPSDLAIANARRLLPQMYEITPRRFEVYPTPDGEIAIDAPGGYGRSVLLLCDSDGGALCLVNTSGNGDRRARYRTTDTLPDGFLREALEYIREYK